MDKDFVHGMQAATVVLDGDGKRAVTLVRVTEHAFHKFAVALCLQLKWERLKLRQYLMMAGLKWAAFLR